MPLLDIDTFDLSDYLAKSSEIIDKALSKGQHILVHCNAGVSRAPSIVIAYLILKRVMSYDEAFNLVKAARPCIKPNEGFVKQLRTLR
jgi:protein-tyrosine phosphatase